MGCVPPGLHCAVQRFCSGDAIEKAKDALDHAVADVTRGIPRPPALRQDSSVSKHHFVNIILCTVSIYFVFVMMKS